MFQDNAQVPGKVILVICMGLCYLVHGLSQLFTYTRSQSFLRAIDKSGGEGNDCPRNPRSRNRERAVGFSKNFSGIKKNIYIFLNPESICSKYNLTLQVSVYYQRRSNMAQTIIFTDHHVCRVSFKFNYFHPVLICCIVRWRRHSWDNTKELFLFGSLQVTGRIFEGDPRRPVHRWLVLRSGFL